MSRELTAWMDGFGHFFQKTVNSQFPTNFKLNYYKNYREKNRVKKTCTSSVR